MEENNNKTENFVLTEKTISVLQEIENDLKSIYGELFSANTHYETIEDKLSDIATNTEHILS
ncbi:MAG: hypothetical protein ILA02_03520 [Clostridia bacterium]|nr:hypothetical protein [Clostridia bacterium]